MKYDKGYLSLTCRYFEGKVALFVLWPWDLCWKARRTMPYRLIFRTYTTHLLFSSGSIHDVVFILYSLGELFHKCHLSQYSWWSCFKTSMYLLIFLFKFSISYWKGVLKLSSNGYRLLHISLVLSGF